MSRLNRILLVIVIILAIATALVWLKPELFSSFSSFSLSSLNPFDKGKSVPATASPVVVQQPSDGSPLTAPVVADDNDDNTDIIADTGEDYAVSDEPDVIEEIEEELTPFEQEIKQRHESYQTKVYTYKPYEPPVLRNPFERVVSTVYVGEEEEEKISRELSTAEDIRRFVTPELPEGTKFTGLITSDDMRLAIIEVEEETYIAREGDFIQDRYLVKSINDNYIIVEINGYEIVQKLGGEEGY